VGAYNKVAVEHSQPHSLVESHVIRTEPASVQPELSGSGGSLETAHTARHAREANRCVGICWWQASSQNLIQGPKFLAGGMISPFFSYNYSGYDWGA
jgi:hypothetical protein